MSSESSIHREDNFQNQITQIADVAHPVIRDLIALLWSEEVYKTEFSDTFYFHHKNYSLSDLIDWSKKIDNGTEFAKLKSRPLGKYAEELLIFYFKNHNNFNLLANNIQLIEENKTLGEIDFLLQDLKTQEYIHLEFALKYYLKVKKKEEYTFLGPSTKDSLEKKKEKLLKQQSRLLKQHQNLLESQFQKINFQAKVWMKGVRFYPFNKNEEYNHANAWWLNFEDINQLKSKSINFEVIANKKDWIFPYFKENEVDFSNLKAKAEHYFEQKKNALMVVRKGNNKQVIDHGFIMRENWPN